MTETARDVIEKYETTTIEVLEFEIPCDLTEVRQIFVFTQEQPCQNPAAWVLVVRPHHPDHGGIATLLICQYHYDYIVNGGTAWCEKANDYYRLQDFIIRLEPLKPSTTGDTK